MALWAVSASAVISAVAPLGVKIWPDLFEGFSVTWPNVLMLGAVVLLMGSTARSWKSGVPTEYSCERPT